MKYTKEELNDYIKVIKHLVTRYEHDYDIHGIVDELDEISYCIDTSDNIESDLLSKFNIDLNKKDWYYELLLKSIRIFNIVEKTNAK